MLQGISSTLSSLPVASIACTTTGLYIGRNFCAAAIYKIGSMAAKILVSKNASEWDQTSQEYFTIAKKNGARDLTAAASLITIGLVSGCVKEKSCPKKESSYIEAYALPVSVGAIIGWAFKRIQVFKALDKSMFTPFTTDFNLRTTRFKAFEKSI